MRKTANLNNVIYTSVKHGVFYCFLSMLLSSCGSAPKNKSPQSEPSPLPKLYKSNFEYQSRYICQNIDNYIGRVVGDGQCVSLIKQCSSAPQTANWSTGKKVLSLPEGAIKPGSIIATFKNGKYPNMSGYHAAIYIEHNKNGIWVWYQWSGKEVHKRLIRTRYDNASASNTAQAYRLVN